MSECSYFLNISILRSCHIHSSTRFPTSKLYNEPRRIYWRWDALPLIITSCKKCPHEGKNNCYWSSCREGCTKEIYTCWQVHRESLRGGQETIWQYPYNKQSGQIITLSHHLLSIMYRFYQIEVFYSPFSEDLDSGGRGIGRLFPNVKVKKHKKWQVPKSLLRAAAIRLVCSVSPSLRSLELLDLVSPVLSPRWILVLSFTHLTLARWSLLICLIITSTFVHRFTPHWFIPSSFPFAYSPCPPST